MSRTGVLEGQLGMDAALSRTDGSDWQVRARDAILRFCRADVSFTAETLRDAVGDPPGTGNAIGALLHELASSGLIVEAGSRRAERPDARGRRLIVWRAAVYDRRADW